jgi:hypothetical protein
MGPLRFWDQYIDIFIVFANMYFIVAKQVGNL